MNGSLVDCQNYAGSIQVKCSIYNPVCKIRAGCWEDKVRALQIVDYVCNKNPNVESCEFQRKNMRANIAMDCDNKKLSDY